MTLRFLSSSTAAAISSALEEDCFLSSRTREPCLVILAFTASISSWRALPDGGTVEEDMVRDGSGKVSLSAPGFVINYARVVAFFSVLSS